MFTLLTNLGKLIDEGAENIRELHGVIVHMSELHK